MGGGWLGKDVKSDEVVCNLKRFKNYRPKTSVFIEP